MSNDIAAFMILGLIIAVMAIAMPFFVFRIRNEVISMRKKMDTMIKLLQAIKGESSIPTKAKKVRI
jgi:hypothetical protein